MKILFSLLILLISLNAQLRLTIDTDKDVYEYGETIRIYCTLHNDDDTSVTFFASNYNSCQAEFFLNDHHSYDWELCLPTVQEITFPPHSQRIYSWTINPHVYGLPDKDGEQVLIGYFRPGWNTFSTDHLRDTTTFYAPVFLGGQIEVNYYAKNQAKVDSISEHFNVEIINHTDYDIIDKSSELWQFANIHIDSAYNALVSDSTFTSVHYNRFLGYDSIFVTTVKKIDDLEKDFTLYQNYPNPFNPTTKIKFSIAESGYVTLKVYDVLGREHGKIVDEFKEKGLYTVSFNANDLASGIYFYILNVNDYSEIKKMLLMR